MTTQLFVLHSEHSTQVLVDALSRAAFHLRKEGYGNEDMRTAEVLENISLHGPGMVEVQVVNILNEAIERAKKP